MKKRLLLLVAVALLLPVAALADNIEELDFTGGTLVGTNAGFALTGSTLTGESSDWLGYITGSNLGDVSFTTNALADGSVGLGADILPGGTVTITGNGSNPNLTGVLFQGTFLDGATWSSWNNVYTLTGYVNGATGTDLWTDGTFTLQVDESGNTPAASGYAVLAVPEPGSLGMMGTGLLGLLGAIRRKIKA